MTISNLQEELKTCQLYDIKRSGRDAEQQNLNFADMLMFLDEQGITPRSKYLGFTRANIAKPLSECHIIPTANTVNICIPIKRTHDIIDVNSFQHIPTLDIPSLTSLLEVKQIRISNLQYYIDEVPLYVTEYNCDINAYKGRFFPLVCCPYSQIVCVLEVDKDVYRKAFDANKFNYMINISYIGFFVESPVYRKEIVDGDDYHLDVDERVYTEKGVVYVRE